VDNGNSDVANDDGDDRNSDAYVASQQSKNTRRTERLNRRMRRAAGGSRGQSKQIDSSASNDFPPLSPGTARQLADSKPPVTVLRARRAKPCSYCHVPYHHRIAPFSNMKLVPCLLCGKKWVPEILLATVEPPGSLPIRGSGIFVQARGRKQLSC